VAEACDGASLDCPEDGLQPDGASCSADATGSWGTCVLASTCSGDGTRSRTRTAFSCQAGTCTGTDTEESEACTANTAGSPCGTPSYGPWGSCTFSSTCDETGTRTRTVTRFTCSAGGACNDPQTRTETGSCTRDTDGAGCTTTQYGSWSSCAYSSDCATSAPDRTRSVTTYACKAGSCSPSTTTQRGTCSRATEGDPCAPFSYDAWSPCGGYAHTCDETGVQSRREYGKKCSAGACVNYTGTQTRSCSRDTDGRTCGRTGCGDTCRAGACELKCGLSPACNYC